MNINVVIVGQFKNKSLLWRSIKVYTSADYVIEVVLVVWQKEAELNRKLIGKIEENGVTVVVTPEPKKVHKNIFYQMHAFQFGLKSLKDKSLSVFKTRTDVYIADEYLFKIIHLDRKTSLANSRLKEKIWVPWFEITKPYYIADECFLASYEDSQKLYNFDTSFDSVYEIDAGISHIRRFIHLDDMNSEEVKQILLRFLKTGHGTVKRNRLLKFNLGCLEYHECMLSYLDFLKNSFRVGINNQVAPYILFRQWSSPNKKLIGDVPNDYDIRNSFNKISGAIKTDNEKLIFKYYDFFKTQVLKNENSNSLVLKSYSDEQYIRLRDELLRTSINDYLRYQYLNIFRYLRKVMPG